MFTDVVRITVVDIRQQETEEFWEYSKGLTIFNNNKPLFYHRYVDDIFCVFNDKTEVSLFFDYINKLPFLDVLLTKSHDNCVTSTYHKPTYTGLLTNYFSFTPSTYKTGLIRTLIDRAWKLNNKENGFKQDLKNIIFTLQRNSFPFHFINNTIQCYLNNNKNTDCNQLATNIISNYLI